MENIEQTPPEEKISRRGFLKRLIGLSGRGEDASLGDTARLSTVVAVGIVATEPILQQVQDSMNVQLGNSSFDEPHEVRLMKENPLTLMLIGTVVSPVLEEGAFRIVPSLLSPKRWGTAWRVGVPSSILFSGAHSLDVKKNDQDIELVLDSIPVYQFAGGLYLWKLARDRGYLHAILAHSIINSILVPLFLLSPDNTPPENNPNTPTENI